MYVKILKFKNSTGSTVLSILNRLEASNREIMKRMDKLEKNNTAMSTPMGSPVLNTGIMVHSVHNPQLRNRLLER